MEPNRTPINTLYSLGNIQPQYEVQYDDVITHVVCTKTGNILKPTLNPYNGYYYYSMDSVEIAKNGKFKRKKVYLQKTNHLAHNKNGPYEQINHEDGNKKNNSPINLHPCTAQENIKHAYENHLIDRDKNVFRITYKDGLQVQDTAMKLYDRMGIHPKKVYEIYKNGIPNDEYNIQSIVLVN